MPRAETLAGVRVLAVDDDRESLQLVSLALEMNGAVVKCAASAVDALTLLEEFGPDVLVSGLGMPAVTGFDLIRAIREMPADAAASIPALAISARREAADEARRCGFDGFLPKPVFPEGLTAAVRNLLEAGRSGPTTP